MGHFWECWLTFLAERLTTTCHTSRVTASCLHASMHQSNCCPWASALNNDQNSFCRILCQCDVDISDTTIITSFYPFRPLSKSLLSYELLSKDQKCDLWPPNSYQFILELQVEVCAKFEENASWDIMFTRIGQRDNMKTYFLQPRLSTNNILICEVKRCCYLDFIIFAQLTQFSCGFIFNRQIWERNQFPNRNKEANHFPKY